LNRNDIDSAFGRNQKRNRCHTLISQDRLDLMMPVIRLNLRG